MTEKTAKKRTIISLIVSIAVFVVIFALALMLGRYQIRIDQFFKAVFTNDAAVKTQRSIIVNLRFPRTIMAAFVGVGLSLSGLLYQETFRNKLVSPDLLGVSTGASVGAALAIILGLSSAFISIFAFVMGLATVAITVLISKLFRNGSSTILLLSGIIVGGFMSAILSIMKYLSSDITTLASITYWLMGSFESANMSRDYILMGVVIVCVVVLMLISHPINLVNQGRSEAQTKGINYNFYRLLIIILSTVLTAISVCFCGTISWVGLIIPHIVRLLVGRDAKRTIPLCVTFGATFMIAVDIISRSFTDSEIPLSAVTGLFGTVVFAQHLRHVLQFPVLYQRVHRHMDPHMPQVGETDRFLQLPAVKVPGARARAESGIPEVYRVRAGRIRPLQCLPVSRRSQTFHACFPSHR